MDAAIAQMLASADVTGINAEREYEFPGESLKFFEKTPTSGVELLSLTTGWCARRKPSNDLSSNDWEFEIIDREEITAAITNKTAFMTIGDLKFKGVKRDSTAGNLGVWKFVTEKIP